jgi:hypothetical protein
MVTLLLYLEAFIGQCRRSVDLADRHSKLDAAIKGGLSQGCLRFPPPSMLLD